MLSAWLSSVHFTQYISTLYEKNHFKISKVKNYCDTDGDFRNRNGSYSNATALIQTALKINVILLNLYHILFIEKGRSIQIMSQAYNSIWNFFEIFKVKNCCETDGDFRNRNGSYSYATTFIQTSLKINVYLYY